MLCCVVMTHILDAVLQKQAFCIDPLSKGYKE